MGINNVALKLTDESSEKFIEVREKYGLTTSELVRVSVGMFLAHSDALTLEEVHDLMKKYRRVPRKPKQPRKKFNFSESDPAQKELDFGEQQA